MKYISTRGNSPAVAAEIALLQGIAPDGGLYVPEKIPALCEEELRYLSSVDYQNTAVYILRKYLDSFSEEELISSVRDAYARFDDPVPVPFSELGNNLITMELWHGPTSAFKDVALQLFPRLLVLSKAKANEKNEIRILVATSGDTGKAALEGFSDVAGTSICVFYPESGVSEVQKAQMRTQKGNNVNVVGIYGNFDDAQTGVKRIFADGKFADELHNKGIQLSSANSINWGRLLPQIVYYVYSSLRYGNKEPVNYVVPTGNFGNILAAYYAKRMGCPIGKLICASNENHILTDFLRTGTYDRNRQFYQTISPSMDILISSNLERLLFEMTERDAKQVSAWMSELRNDGRYVIPESVLSKIRNVFLAGYCSDADAKHAIHSCWNEFRYLLDPHTAVGYAVYQNLADTLRGKTVLASTASPFKFAVDVLSALGTECDDGMKAMDTLSVLTGWDIPEGLAALKNLEIRFTKRINPSEMKDAVLE